MDLKCLGKTLKESRNAKGWSLRETEEQTGVSNAFISQIEGGKIKQPSPNVLYKLCEAYGLSYSLVMEYAGYPLPEKSQFKSSEQRFMSRLGNVSDSEQTELLEYLSFLRSKRK